MDWTVLGAGDDRTDWLPYSGKRGPRTELIEALRALGYVEGQTITFEVRSAENNLDRLPELAAELVRSRVDIIVG